MLAKRIPQAEQQGIPGMMWHADRTAVEIYAPPDFNFKECLVFLGRSEQEVLHHIKDGHVYKVINVSGELVLLKIGCSSHSIRVELPIHNVSAGALESVTAYIQEWFDLDRELGNFYRMANNDKMLKPLVQKYGGLRLIGIPDLFEALTWAITGQQINLAFAYTLKKRFVEHFGEYLIFEEHPFWIFPSPETVASISVAELRELQFTGRKAEYIIGVAKAIANGELTKDNLLQKRDYGQMKQSLMAMRGIGAWTADYVLMKCFREPSAFPIADAGLQNAIKKQAGLERKPAAEELNQMGEKWKGWQAYATFYLWRSLYE